MYAENCLLMIFASIPPLNALIRLVLGKTSSLSTSGQTKTGGSRRHMLSRMPGHTTDASRDRWPARGRKESDEEVALDLHTVGQPHRFRIWLNGGGKSHREREDVKGIVKTVSFGQESEIDLNRV
jgi:hypothetical protein